MQYNLEPIYDNHLSFYGKAKVVQTNVSTKLYSYNTKVAEIKDNRAYVYNLQSATTLIHVKEFLKQNGFKVDSKRQIEHDYWCDEC